MNTSDKLYEQAMPTLSTKCITYDIDAIPDKMLPACQFKLRVSYKNEATRLDTFVATIIDRVTDDIKEYSLPEEGAVIYYNNKKQISGFSLKFDIDFDPKSNSEFEKVLSLTNDCEATQVYRVMAYHGCALGMGYHLTDIRLGRIDPSTITSIVSDLMSDDSSSETPPWEGGLDDSQG